MFELFVAEKHLEKRRRQTLLAIGAVGLAVAIAIIFRSLQNGIEVTFFDVFFELAPSVLVLPKEGEDYIYLYNTLADFIWTIPGVVAVAPALNTPAALSYEGRVENVEMMGIVPEELNRMTGIGDKYMIEGDLDSIRSGRRVVLGEMVAESLQVKLGDSVVATFPDARPTSLIVSGVFWTGVEVWDRSSLVSLATAREFLGGGSVATSISIGLEDPYQADGVAAEISALGYDARSWRRLYPEFEETIAFRDLTNNLILALLLLISSFGIANVMNMVVLEKTRSIGMLMAMGASSSDIRRIFIIESGVLGLAGGIIGTVVGYSLSVYLDSLGYAITPPNSPQPVTLKFIVDPVDLIALPLLALALSMAAGVYPAHKASHLDPVVALRG